MGGLRTVWDMELRDVPAAESDADAISRLEPGDIILCRSESSWVSRTVAAFDGYWSHATLYTGDGRVAEASISGVGATSVDQLRQRYPVGLAVVRPEADTDTRARAARWAHDLLAGPGEKRYSGFDLGLVYVMLRRASGEDAVAAIPPPTGWELEGIAGRSMYESTCSGLVFRSYLHGGALELPIRVAPGLHVADGKIMLGPEPSAVELLATDQLVEQDFSQVGRRLSALRERVRILTDAVGGIAKGWAEGEVDVERAVSPGDLWLLTEHEQRFFFSPADAQHARELTEPPEGILESLPADLIAALAERDAVRRNAAERSAELEFLVSDADSWPPGSTVTVAFRGGDAELHRQIEEAVQQITEACNLKLDFGFDPVQRCYRQWSEQDTDYAADIRVSFDQRGYWSLVGTASVDPTAGPAHGPSGGRPNQRSLNLFGFDRNLPAHWVGTVRHEFLHALAFKHAHQNDRGPCQQQFRWDDDPGYVPTTDPSGRYVSDAQGRKPGIYTYLSGPPNQWSRGKVDHNLRSTGSVHDVAGPFDRSSVMLYRFPQWFYTSWPSECAPDGNGQELSDGDRRGLKLLYPDTPGTNYPENAGRAAVALEAYLAEGFLEGADHPEPDPHLDGMLAVLTRMVARCE